jgi:hypothetical protein
VQFQQSSRLVFSSVELGVLHMDEPECAKRKHGAFGKSFAALSEGGPISMMMPE